MKKHVVKCLSASLTNTVCNAGSDRSDRCLLLLFWGNPLTLSSHLLVDVLLHVHSNAADGIWALTFKPFKMFI